MLLTVIERLALLNILPEQGNFLTLKIVSDLRGRLSFTEQEMKDMEITELDGGRVAWNVKKDTGKEIEFGERATDITREALRKRNDAEQMTVRDISVYEKFFPNG